MSKNVEKCKKIPKNAKKCEKIPKNSKKFQKVKLLEILYNLLYIINYTVVLA
jgi:hypothetical protein